MKEENVQLWFARDTNNKIIHIKEITENIKHNKYICPLCGSEVIPRQGEEMAWHFAHKDKSKCTTESMCHFWFKHKFLEKGDTFVVKTDISKKYIVDSIEIEKEYIVNDKKYKPDVTVKTSTGEIIYFEMAYSNKKKVEDYLDTWIELGNMVVEVDIKTLSNQCFNQEKEFNALYYQGKCFNIKTIDKEYYNTIGTYKEQLIENNEYMKHKKEIEKLDWVWKDIQEYKIGNKDIEDLSDLIQSIEEINTRYIIVNILKKSKCNYILNDYIEYNENKVITIIKNINNKLKNEKITNKVTCDFIIPHSIYDRIYNLNDGLKLYNNNDRMCINIKEFNEECIFQSIKNLIIEYNNIEKCNLLEENKVLEYVFKYLKRKYSKYEVFDKKYGNRLTRLPVIEVGKTYNQLFTIDLANKEILYSKNRKDIRDFIKNKIKEYEKDIIEIKNINQVISTINNLKSKYRKICSENKINFTVKCENEIQIEFVRNYKGFMYDKYVLLNNNIVWKYWDGKDVTKLVTLKIRENGDIDCEDLNKKLTDMISVRLRNALYE